MVRQLRLEGEDVVLSATVERGRDVLESLIDRYNLRGSMHLHFQPG